MKNPIYIQDAALISPLGSHGFGVTQPMFCTHKGTPVGRIDADSEKALQSLKNESSQYQKLDRSTLLAILAARQLKLESTDAGC